VHVGNLRRKLRAVASMDLIQTVRGVGFRFQEPDKVDA
jgi:DNA-binding response OmpR family regulator